MIKYAKITNQETGLVEVGLGTNNEFYQSIGMTQLDVTQSDIDNNWYLAELCPMKSDEIKAQEVQKKLVEYNYEAKAKKAYGGIIINDTYLFETNETSQSMITASLIGLQSAPDETTLNWKMYVNNQPIVVPLTKAQLAQLFAFALNMVNVSFGLEGTRNNDLTTATVEQLNDETWVEQYKIATDFAFNQINNKIDVVLVEKPTETPTEEPNIENLEEG